MRRSGHCASSSKTPQLIIFCLYTEWAAVETGSPGSTSTIVIVIVIVCGTIVLVLVLELLLFAPSLSSLS
ncbi:hypothetical protein ACLKA6_006546 [Drosophila palustris]